MGQMSACKQRGRGGGGSRTAWVCVGGSRGQAECAGYWVEVGGLKSCSSREGKAGHPSAIFPTAPVQFWSPPVLRLNMFSANGEAFFLKSLWFLIWNVCKLTAGRTFVQSGTRTDDKFFSSCAPSCVFLLLHFRTFSSPSSPFPRLEWKPPPVPSAQFSYRSCIAVSTFRLVFCYHLVV